MPRVTRSSSTQDAAIDIASSPEPKEDLDDDEDNKEEVMGTLNNAAHRMQQHKSQFVMIAPGNEIKILF